MMTPSPKGIKQQRRIRTKPLSRFVLLSDDHEFVGRIYDLSIVGLHFDSYAEVERHPDCKYALDVDFWLSALVKRVESLNLVGDLIWPQKLPKNFKDFPVSRYDWLLIALDVFLVRLISVGDCALILTNEVLELGLKPSKCTFNGVTSKKMPKKLVRTLTQIQQAHDQLRTERNRRVHHGLERGLTDDDQTFRTASLFEHQNSGLNGTDRFGRTINVERSFKSALVEIQTDFNKSTRRLNVLINRLYDCLMNEFESRFGPRIAASTHGLIPTCVKRDSFGIPKSLKV